MMTQKEEKFGNHDRQKSVETTISIEKYKNDQEKAKITRQSHE